jgi:hypothetical protein
VAFAHVRGITRRIISDCLPETSQQIFEQRDEVLNLEP